jgi:mannose-6-phosphate isomerase class I
LLQIEEGLQCVAFDDFEPEVVLPNGETLVQCDHFVVEKWNLEIPRRASERRSFALFVCVNGAVEMDGTRLDTGQFFLVPAVAAASELQPSRAGDERAAYYLAFSLGKALLRQICNPGR